MLHWKNLEFLPLQQHWNCLWVHGGSLDFSDVYLTCGTGVISLTVPWPWTNQATWSLLIFLAMSHKTRFKKQQKSFVSACGSLVNSNFSHQSPFKLQSGKGISFHTLKWFCTTSTSKQTNWIMPARWSKELVAKLLAIPKGDDESFL